MKAGMKIPATVIIECVGFLWWEVKRIMLMSGRIESTMISGMLILVFSNRAEDLPRRYARAMWPTANEEFVPPWN